ncbi:4Fe-4S dicluster domain-containing protein [Methanonatronarchaeum sp. AMET-Sl]|uniref:4Fe-4S dicluster domain-containing protein n=1 Tax=Methanonatronarchaeum sp. AMET-Sl TaxID=3037654 RepID=UPI00244E1012|nr:4Fe-4S dicluster domain-containing protein [Methanonatronarchaeum sp. AMET-Sl]WGI17612.1 4Fe-4S binding protein [Methanonatronarchaeum sp. AMET-Sl]
MSGNERVLVDVDLCRGCRRCEVLCSWNKNLSRGRAVVNPRSSGIRVRSDERDGVFEPVVCSQCSSADCLEACSHDALTRTDGVVVVDQELCVGCGDCTEVCSHIWLDPDSEVVVKCDLCGDSDPVCVDGCKHDVLRCI